MRADSEIKSLSSAGSRIIVSKQTSQISSGLRHDNEIIFKRCVIKSRSHASASDRRFNIHIAHGYSCYDDFCKAMSNVKTLLKCQHSIVLFTIN